ncbi:MULTISPECIES: hypothetical protein [Niastella]|uniref:Uncharacterized protein n=1 Tax=Niastella soli TaxID=2821487 RepID=A0ABS3Z5I1_9BACT|nr:hypothetical protein [Niastella soli]MBO9205417.1 hypothetical protein [Niastella soli]
MQKRLLLFSAIIILAASLSAFCQHTASTQFKFIDSLFTKEQYQVELLDLRKKGPAEVRSTGSVQVNRTANVVTFSTPDKNLKFLESLKVDLQNEIILYMDDTLPFLDEYDAPATSSYGEWHGFTWLKSSSYTAENDVIVIDKQTIKSIQVDFGKVKNNNKILVHINYKEQDHGHTKVQNNIACYLN